MVQNTSSFTNQDAKQQKKQDEQLLGLFNDMKKRMEDFEKELKDYHKEMKIELEQTKMKQALQAIVDAEE